MSETEEDRAYYAAGEAAFVARRGTPFLLSPRDFALLKEWRALGVPIEAVEIGIDEAFTRREERGATRRVNSLEYCRDAVLSVWERRAETAVGRGRESGEPDAARAEASIEKLAQRLEEVGSRHPDLAGVLGSARRSLEKLSKSAKPAAQVEASLSRLDRRLSKEVYEVLSPARRERLDSRVEALLAKARIHMDRETEEKTRKALTRRTLREELGLTRLTLLGD